MINFQLSTNKVFQLFEGDAAFVQSLTENNGRYADNFQMAYIIGTAYASTGYQIEFRKMCIRDRMYIDFAGDKLEVVDSESGECRSVEVFEMCIRDRMKS